MSQKMMLLLPSLTVVVVFLASVATAQNSSNTSFCPHGLTANDIAERSGLDLTGKVALVTGGRSGLGYAISEALLRLGCTVVLASRNLEKNQEAVLNLTSTVGNGADVSFMTFDLESFGSVNTLARDFAANYSRLDYYFGNAGQGSPEGEQFTVDGYERIFQVNYVAQVLLLERLLPLLRQSEDGRVVLTASSTHSLACGSLGLTPEDECWGDGSALALLPLDVAGMDAINSTFQCEPLYSSYPITKYLMTQLAREVSKREADAGNPVYAFSWAPGNIFTDLNQWARCCVGPIDRQTCRYQLPYVGPRDEDGNPAPPEVPVTNFWTSPAHGAMAGVYTALMVDPTQAGSFFATYWECQQDKGYFPQGVTPEAQSEIHDLSLTWARVNETSSTTVNETSSTTTSAAAARGTVGLGTSSSSMVLAVGVATVLLSLAKEG